MKPIGICALLAASVFLTISPVPLHGQTFVAMLTGGSAVPPVDTPATGIALFVFAGPDMLVTLAMHTVDPTQVTGTSLHLGISGVTGPAVVDLLADGGMPFGSVTVYVNTSGDLQGPLQGMSLAELNAEMVAGNVYMNVPSIAFPQGEIRGQVAQVSPIFRMIFRHLVRVARNKTVRTQVDSEESEEEAEEREEQAEDRAEAREERAEERQEKREERQDDD
jgi:hypothetical protein